MTKEFETNLVFLSDAELKELGMFEFMDLLKTCNIVPKDLRMCWRPEQAEYTGEEFHKRFFFVDGNRRVWAFGYDEVSAFKDFLKTLVRTERLPKAKSYDELIMKLKLGWRK